MEGKYPLDGLLMLGGKGAFLPVGPVVERPSQRGDNLGLDLLCRGMGNLVKNLLYAPGQLDWLIAAEDGAGFPALRIAGGIHRGDEGLVLGAVLVGKEAEAPGCLGAVPVLAEGEVVGNVKVHGHSVSWILRGVNGFDRENGAAGRGIPCFGGLTGEGCRQLWYGEFSLQMEISIL